MRTTLPNGLVLVVDENHTAPVAAFQVWVRAGSADEWPGEHGLAHLHEHMLFKGTQRRGPGELAQAIESAGGEINAWTGLDHTVFHCVVASRFWTCGLDVLADAITSAAFDPQELAREVEVVCEEMKRTLDSPTRRLSKLLFSAAFTAHPYGRPVIGTAESVRALSRDQVLRFYRRWYQPEHCVLLAVGDLEPGAVRALAERLFTWPEQPGVPALDAPLSFLPAPARPKEPARGRSRIALEEAPLREGVLSLAFPAPGQEHEDVAALDALMLVLGHGESARLSRALLREPLLCSDAQASSYTPRDPGLTVLSLSLRPAQVKQAVAATLREVVRLRHEEVSEEELELACRVLESEAVYERETAQGLARQLGFWEVSGHAGAERRYFERVAALTPEKLRAAAKRHLNLEQLVLAAILPSEARVSYGVGEASLRALVERALEHDQDPARHEASRAPARTQVKVRAVPKVLGEPIVLPLRRVEVPGGGVLLLKVERSAPLLSLRAAWNGGLRAETPESGGAHQLLSRLVDRGTTNRDAEALFRDVERLGGSLSGSTGRNSFGLRLDALGRAQDEAVDLFCEALCEPAFAPKEVEREKLLQREELRARDDNPGGVAFRLFETTLWTQHPYRLDLLGSPDSLLGHTADSLGALRALRYVPAGAVIAAVGDFDPERVCDMLLRRLEPFAKAARTAPRPAPGREPELLGPRVGLRTLEKAQAQLLLGFPGVTLSDPSRHAVLVLAALLSGQGGRLFRELRDVRGLAYSASALSMEGVDPGFFALHVACDPQKLSLAVQTLRGELSRLREERVREAELSRTKARLLGAQAIGRQRTSARAALFAFDECYGLGAEASLHAADALSAVTADDVLTLAQRLLDPHREVAALVCPSGEVPREFLPLVVVHEESA